MFLEFFCHTFLDEVDLVCGYCVHEDDDLFGDALVPDVVGLHAITRNFEHVLVLFLRFIEDYPAGRVKGESGIRGAATANNSCVALGCRIDGDEACPCQFVTQLIRHFRCPKDIAALGDDL